uniref:Uncharacterized protein n=1 Tax=Panagrolaimus davidi TaxID=227884 RepID=A0A914P5B5_9BILA
MLYLSDLIISYNDFLFISSNVESIGLTRVVVKNEDATIVPLEKLVKALPKIKYIYLNENHKSSMITKNTFKELLIIPHFSKISNINLHGIPETFDFEKCFAFIKKNKQIEFSFVFSHEVSAACKTRLEAIIDEILQTENHNYKVPDIFFSGGDPEKSRKLRSLFDNN